MKKKCFRKHFPDFQSSIHKLLYEKRLKDYYENLSYLTIQLSNQLILFITNSFKYHKVQGGNNQKQGSYISLCHYRVLFWFKAMAVSAWFVDYGL